MYYTAGDMRVQLEQSKAKTLLSHNEAVFIHGEPGEDTQLPNEQTVSDDAMFCIENKGGT